MGDRPCPHPLRRSQASHPCPHFSPLLSPPPGPPWLLSPLYPTGADPAHVHWPPGPPLAGQLRGDSCARARCPRPTRHVGEAPGTGGGSRRVTSPAIRTAQPARGPPRCAKLASSRWAGGSPGRRHLTPPPCALLPPKPAAICRSWNRARPRAPGQAGAPAPLPSRCPQTQAQSLPPRPGDTLGSWNAAGGGRPEKKQMNGEVGVLPSARSPHLGPSPRLRSGPSTSPSRLALVPARPLPCHGLCPDLPRPFPAPPPASAPPLPGPAPPTSAPPTPPPTLSLPGPCPSLSCPPLLWDPSSPSEFLRWFRPLEPPLLSQSASGRAARMGTRPASPGMSPSPAPPTPQQTRLSSAPTLEPRSLRLSERVANLQGPSPLLQGTKGVVLLPP